MRRRPADLPGHRAFRVGAWLWIVVGVGHLVLVHVLSLGSGKPWLATDPALLDAMRASPVDGGRLGATDLFSAFHGFSLWVTVSLVGLGLLDLAVLGSGPGPRLFRRAAAINAALAAALAALAWIEFLRPPQVASVVVLACFLRALTAAPVAVSPDAPAADDALAGGGDPPGTG